MMKGMFKRALAGVAAAALAVTGMTVLTGAANAADGTVVSNDATHKASITFTASSREQLTDRTLKAYKIGDWVNYGTEENPLYGLVTTTDISQDLIERALTTGTGVTVPDSEPSDYLSWAVSSEGPLDQSLERPWQSTDNLTDSVSRKFAEYLADNVASLGTPIDLVLDDPQPVSGGTEDRVYSAAITNNTDDDSNNDIDPGMWLIVDESGESTEVTQAVPMLVTTGANPVNGAVADPFEAVEINLKNTRDTTAQTKTSDKDETGVTVGDTITYTLTGKVTNPAPTSYTFRDRPGTGLTINLPTTGNTNNFSVVLSKDGQSDVELAYGTGYTITNNLLGEGKNMGGEGASFDVVIPGSSLEGHEDWTITVTYTATVNAQADLEDGVANSLVNDNKESIVTDKVEFYKFTFTKLDAQGNELKDAVFTITDADGSTLPGYTGGDQNGATSTSNADGHVTFKGLALNTMYTVTETGVPNGFQDYHLSFKVVLTKGENGSVTATFSDEDSDFKIAQFVDTTNNTVTNVQNFAAALPLTGAAGITMFVVLGLLIAGAGVTVYMKSRGVRNAMRA